MESEFGKPALLTFVGCLTVASAGEVGTPTTQAAQIKQATPTKSGRIS